MDQFDTLLQSEIKYVIINEQYIFVVGCSDWEVYIVLLGNNCHCDIELWTYRCIEGQSTKELKDL